MNQVAKFIINGRPYELPIEPNLTLNELLRDKLDLTGTKFNCGVAQCGCCTVLVNGKPTLSCSTLAISARDKEILTIEGLAKGQTLHPLQKAFINYGGVQCGWCTPGMILTSLAFLKENPNPTRAEVAEGLGGNVCRCTGYIKIIDAVMAAAKEMQTESVKS